MPVVFAPPSSVLVPASSLPARAQHSIAVATQGFDLPAGVPGLRNGLNVLTTAVDHLLLSIGTPTDALLWIQREVADARELAPKDAGSIRSLQGALGSHVAWGAVLALHEAEEATSDQLLILGARYCCARLGRIKLARSPMELILRSCLGSRAERRSLQNALRAAASAALSDARERFDRRRLDLDRDRITAIEIAVALRLQRAQSFPSTRHLRVIATGTDLLAEEVVACCTALVKGMQAGDVACALIALAYWIGLPMHLVLALSLHPKAHDIVVVSLIGGWVSVNLATALAQLAKARYPGAVATSDVLQRPIPRLILATLAGAANTTPAARTYRDLLKRRSLDGRSPIPGVDPAHAKRWTADKVIAARSRLLIDNSALDPKTDLATVAYACLDLHLLPKSAYHYICVASEQILAACSKWSDLCGFGALADFEPRLGIGSRVTPKEDQIVAAYDWFRRHVAEASPGNRYSEDGLMEYHNRYAAAVTWLLCLMLGIRHVRRIALLASMFLDPELVRGFVDKRSSNLPLPPLVCCAEVQEIVRLWLTHCAALRERLCNLGNPKLTDAIDHLEGIFEGHAVELLFTLRNHRVIVAGTWLWATQLPKSLSMKQDAGRHFWPDSLRHEGATLSDVEYYLRHVVERRELLVSTNGRNMAAWRGRVCDAQQRVVVRLGLRALVGLARA